MVIKSWAESFEMGDLSLATVTLSNIGGGIYSYGRPIVALGMSSMRQRPTA